jgi:hypothetical protein
MIQPMKSVHPFPSLLEDSAQTNPMIGMLITQIKDASLSGKIQVDAKKEKAFKSLSLRQRQYIPSYLLLNRVLALCPRYLMIQPMKLIGMLITQIKDASLSGKIQVDAKKEKAFNLEMKLKAMGMDVFL